jgi:membrane complex biogenesis BtpA family protein
MIHVQPLPGSPQATLDIDAIVAKAVTEAKVLADSGFDAIIIENMHDRPYIHGRHGPETVAAMTRVGLAVRAAAPMLPLGVQVLSGGNMEALAIALACGGSFIRCENFVFAHVADEGLLERAEAGPLLRYRKQIGAEHIKVFCDIKKKHASHAITADIPVADAVEAAEFFGADGVIITGTATGKPCRTEDLAGARAATRLPVLVGSGVTPESVPELFRYADSLIVGSWFKKDGLWSNPPDPDRCKRLVAAAQSPTRDPKVVRG